MTWQDAGVIVIVGLACAYVVRKFFPRRSKATPSTFVSVQQLKQLKKPKPKD